MSSPSLDAAYYWGAYAAPSSGGTVTVYASGDSGQIQSFNATYLTARSGSGLSATAGGTHPRVGQLFSTPNYFCWEMFAAFDTSAIPSGATVTSAVLSMYAYSDHATQSFTINAYASDWGATLTTADWVAGASLSGLTLVATRSTVGMTEASYHDFTDVALPANVTKAGTTRLLLASSLHAAGTTPDADEEYFYADGVPDGSPLKLVVVWS